MSQPASERGDGTYTRATTVQSRRVRWLWKQRLALGYLGVWTGPGDIGKSLFAGWVVRGVTLGELEGEFFGTPCDVLIVATEDGREDMWKPRLVAVGADLDRISFLDTPDGWNLRDGIGLIADALDGTGAVLVFIDAAMEHMPPSRGGENVNSPTFVRGAMRPLAALARKRHVAPLFGLHPSKGRAETFADTVQASGAFSQLSRTGLLFGYHPDDQELPREAQRRVVLRGKGNAGRNPGALSYRITERLVCLDDGDSDLIAYVTDVQPCEITERQLLQAERPQARDGDGRLPSKAEQVERLIRDRLADGEWHESMTDELVAAGFAATTVGRARTTLCQRPRKGRGSMTEGWEWRLRPEFVKDVCELGTSSEPRARTGHPDEMCVLVTSGDIPNKQGIPQLTHESNERPGRAVELPNSHNAGNTPRASARDPRDDDLDDDPGADRLLSEDEFAARVIAEFDGTEELGPLPSPNGWTEDAAERLVARHQGDA